MDLVEYDEVSFNAIRRDFTAFLESANVTAKAFVPISAFTGENLVTRSPYMPWYQGGSLLEIIDELEKRRSSLERPLRLPVQDVYKFTEDGDDRRIIAGTVVSGAAQVGDSVVFLPSGKRSTIKTIEGFAQSPQSEVHAGFATGVTLATQVYVRPGEVLCREDQPAPTVSTNIKTSLFWLGRQPLVRDKRYKIKLCNASTSARVTDILNVIDASDLESQGRRQHVDRHEVAECILETTRPLAFDIADENPEMGRFVLVDEYRIVGGGIITGTATARDDISLRNIDADTRGVTPEERYQRYRQHPKLVLITGKDSSLIEQISCAVERRLFEAGRYVFHLAGSQLIRGADGDLRFHAMAREEHVRRLSEIARLFAQVGCILLASLPDTDDVELSLIRRLAAPSEVVSIGVSDGSLMGILPDLTLPEGADLMECGDRIASLLVEEQVLVDFEI